MVEVRQLNVRKFPVGLRQALKVEAMKRKMTFQDFLALVVKEGMRAMKLGK